MGNEDCNSCDLCDSCNSCDSCKLCDSSNFCYLCDSSNFCYLCDSCNLCEKCENLVNGFMCINFKFKKRDKTKYWIFNKEVSKEEWDNRFEIGVKKR